MKIAHILINKSVIQDNMDTGLFIPFEIKGVWMCLERNKGSKFLKKLWCCVGGSTTKYIMSDFAIIH